MRSILQHSDPTERAWRGATLSVEHRVNPICAGSWQCDLADNSLRWSPPIFALFGLDPAMPVDRRDALEMYDSDSRDMMERLRAKAIDERGSFTMEAQIQRADGAMRWMRLTADVVCRAGRASHLYGTKQDITQEMTA